MFYNYISQNYLLISLSLSLLSIAPLHAQVKSPHSIEKNTGFGYTVKGDSIEFIFGQQQKIIVGGVEVLLEQRINEINQVNIAGDFNGWNPNDAKFQMTRMEGTLFKKTVCKNNIGKKGELKQFKFVLNHTYWVEPPDQASNKFTGKDGYTNLTLKL